MENKQTATKGTKSWQQFEINPKRAKRIKKIKIKEKRQQKKKFTRRIKNMTHKL